MAKYTKEGVHYRKGTQRRHCGNCTMFHQPNACTAVEGNIKPEDLCDVWKGESGRKGEKIGG